MTSTATKAAPKEESSGAPAPWVEPPEPAETRRGRWRPEVVTLVLGIASLPMLLPGGLPPGPGNTAIPDAVLVVFAFAVFLWAGTRRVPVRWPYLLPTLLTVLAGGVAALANDNAGALTLVKDVFVLLWAVCVANLCRDPALLRVTLRAFVGIGTFYALVMMTGFAIGNDAMSGKQIDGSRLMFTFGDANYAANWFICIFFIARAARWPETRWRRWTVCGILITAELLTGSNGGMLALSCALLLGYLFRLFREGKAHHAIVVGAAAVFVGGAGITLVTQVDVQPFLDRASEASPLLRDSIGRTTGESTESRSTVFSTTWDMIQAQPHPWGIGAAETERQMLVQQETYVREAHNDYIASVLERGFLGGLALVLLLSVLVVRCVRIARRGALKPEYARLVPHPELFGALLVVFVICGLFYEVLHYRHGFAIFGLIAALDLFGRRTSGASLRPAPAARLAGDPPAPPAPPAPRRIAVRYGGAREVAPVPGRRRVNGVKTGIATKEPETGKEPGHDAGRSGLRGRLVQLVAGNMAARVGALASLGVATILVARVGGPTLVGAFTLVRILPGLLCHLSNAGLPAAAPYFLAQSDRDQSRVRPTLAWLTVIGAVLAGVGWLALSPLLLIVFFKSFGIWLTLAAAVPAFTQGFVSVGKGLLQGTDDPNGASLAIAVEEFVFLPIYIAILVGWHGTGALVAGLVLADLAAAAWIARRLARRGFFRGWGRPDARLGRSIAGYGIRGYVGQLIDLLQLRFDMALLGALAGPKTLGVYTVASKFAELVQLPGLAVNYVLYPDFAREDKRSAARRTAALILPALGVSVLAALPLALIAGTALPWVFGDVFDDAVVPTYIRLAGVVTFGVTGLVMAYLYGVGRPGAASTGQGIGLLVVVVLGTLLIPAHGAAGAAVATSVSFLTTTAALLAWFQARQEQGVTMSKDFTARPIDPSDGIPPSRGRRALDIIAALTGLLLLSVPMMLIYVLVRLTSRGRGIFKQTRVGQGGRPFTMYKFRTMRQGVGGMKVTATSDPRVTPLGRFLRRYYLDELPQLVNVLRGDMTLVGARPETYDLAVYYDTRWRWIFDHRPGITGLSQVSFRYAEILPPGQEVDLAFYVEHLAPAQSAADAVYLSNPSMRVTLRVLLRTVRYILGFKVPQLPVSGSGNVSELTSPSDAAHRAKEPGSAA